jgi:hypothetical protein
METEFSLYLDNLRFYAHQKNLNILLESKAALAQAQAGKLRKLTRLFLDFPLQYSVAHAGVKKSFCAVLPIKLERWQQKFNELVQSGKFEVATLEANTIITADEATQNRIQKLSLDILINACADLVAGENQLKPLIVNFFGLSELLMQHQHHAVGLKKILYGVIYSYWLEIVMVNLGMQAIQQDCNIRQLEALNGYAKQMLRQDQQFSPFFVASIQTFYDDYRQSDLLECLRYLPADRISGKVSISVYRESLECK